ncbi:MAG: restriction endonuclease [Methanomicrobiaceae archaeon]|nr:restriction endonuclease [Methanomicrobiaceae archaeon]
MNLLDAAYQVLLAEDRPLHYREISQRMLELGLWSSGGKTPWNSVNAGIAMDIKKNGDDSRFYRAAPGIFGCREGAHPNPAPESGPEAGSMSFLDAAETVLEEYAGGQPMHYRNITKKALDLHLITTGGLTPDATMYAGILTEIQRQIKRGELPRFEMLGKGYVGLTRWHEQGLPYQIEVHNREVRDHLMQRIKVMNPVAFEELIGELLAKMGFEDVIVTRASGDGGIDVRGTLVIGDVIKTKMAIQAKRWKGNVQAPVVQQVRGSLGVHEQGLIITTSDFSGGARKEAEQPDKTPIALMNGKQMVNLLIEHDIGVVRTGYDLIDLEENEE